MNYGMMKVAAAIPAVKVAAPMFNEQSIETLISEAAEKNVEVICFPELSITGYSCQDLFHNQQLLEIFGDIKLCSYLRILTITHITSVDPEHEIARSRPHMEDDLLPCPCLGEDEGAAVGACVVVALAYKRWIGLEGSTPGVSYILVDTVAIAVDFK